MSIWTWSRWLAPVPESARLTLGEGNTPLIRSRRLGPSVGLKNLFFKLEFTSPTGSYKDRFAVTAVSDMVANGKSVCIATSSGNTGAALAAYCAVAGIQCEIAIVEGAPIGKLRQMLAYGAKLFRVRSFGTDSRVSGAVWDLLGQLSRRPEAALQISAFCFSPVGMSGVYSLSHELAAEAEQPWDHVFCMAGGGGLVLAVARGFEQALSAGTLSRLPRTECVQPAGNDTIAGALRAGRDESVAVDCTSKISGLQVPNVVDGNAVIAACRRNGGTGHLVEDTFVWETQKRLAREEAIFSEPAGATAVAGCLQAAMRGELDPHAYICCLVTGSAFKDPPSVEVMTQDSNCPLIELSDLERRVRETQ
ncbi:MAG TPA: pyridoxal-phosphate dependent enzyme [Planctomycetaceae bacterium]|nr:pyridoxal-phosphate dependent enzyme [Planctomycetaceae bacterium]